MLNTLIGVDEMSWDDMNKNHMAWPSVREVTEYRREVFNTIKNLIFEHRAFDSFASELDKYVINLPWENSNPILVGVILIEINVLM